MNKMKNKLVMPIVKWVGGKRQLLSEINERIPKKIGTYYEPFFGGGAVLFNLQPKKAVINDINTELINTYRVIKNSHLELIESLKQHKNESEYFYKMRDKDRNKSTFNKMTNIDRASRLIYLNKTCYNGLYRVNSSGEFNTPFGGYKRPNIVNEPTIKAVHEYFSNNSIEMLNIDFEKVVENAKKGDFVYFDPPYDPISTSSNFTGYNEMGFKKEDQLRLRDLCRNLNDKGVNFMVSNSASEFIQEIYSEFNIDFVKARRSVNSKANGRGEINEVIVRNY